MVHAVLQRRGCEARQGRLLHRPQRLRRNKGAHRLRPQPARLPYLHRSLQQHRHLHQLQEQIREAFRLAGLLAVATLAVDHIEVIDLAAQTRLTTYDASYLWLARKMGGELVTLDKRLRKASGG